MAEPSAAVVPVEAGAPSPRLDELMLAMDVVDTLRHQEGLALKELGQVERDAVLKQRLRTIYEGQGLVVSDDVLQSGIAALKESRFTYTPPPPGPAVTMAKLWVRRALVGKVLAILAIVVIAAIGWQAWSTSTAQRAAESARIELTETLPRSLEAAAASTLAEARDSEAKATVEAAIADARAALASQDIEATRRSIAAIDTLRANLVKTYTLRIVSRPGEPSGVFRVPDVNTGARNHYLIVEAVTPDGEVLSMPVTSEEDGRESLVSTWGVRVPESVYDAVRRDKEADGIVDDAIVAEKPRGALSPVYLVPVAGGAITSW
jgi:hypothetical protein